MARCRGRLFGASRASRGGLACAFGALALVAAGCGTEEHVNDARPQPPTRVSVAIAEDTITVQPPRIAFGPEPTQQIPQNQHTTQPRVRSKAPLEVVLVAANLTDDDAKLEVRGSGKDAASEPLVANGSISLQTTLPTGVYKIVAPGVPGLKPGRLAVGPFRTSSENDVLLP